MSKTLKRGDKIKNIRLIDDSQNIECRIGKSLLVIKNQFIKKPSLIFSFLFTIYWAYILI